MHAVIKHQIYCIHTKEVRQRKSYGMVDAGVTVHVHVRVCICSGSWRHAGTAGAAQCDSSEGGEVG